MGYKLTWMYIRPNNTEQKIWPTETILFDYWDWTDSVWTAWPNVQSSWTITKTSSNITFYQTRNYLSEYPIDWTKDFLLEFNGNLPSTNLSYSWVGLITSQGTWIVNIQTNWEHYNEMAFETNWNKSYSWETNPWTVDYFIKKEWNVLTMGWGGVAKYTNSNYTFESEYFLQENVYTDNLTINTAKLTYL